MTHRRATTPAPAGNPTASDAQQSQPRQGPAERCHQSPHAEPAVAFDIDHRASEVDGDDERQADDLGQAVAATDTGGRARMRQWLATGGANPERKPGESCALQPSVRGEVTRVPTAPSATRRVPSGRASASPRPSRPVRAPGRRRADEARAASACHGMATASRRRPQ